MNKKLEDASKALFNLRFQKALQQLDHPQQIRLLRKEIAQIKTVLNNISGTMEDFPIVPKTPKQFYECLNSLGDLEYLEYFPLCNFSHKKTVYRKIFKKIGEIMVKIQKDYNDDNFSLANQTPLEAVIQNYMIEIYKHKKYHEHSFKVHL